MNPFKVDDEMVLLATEVDDEMEVVAIPRATPERTNPNDETEAADIPMTAFLAQNLELAKLLKSQKHGQIHQPS